MLRKALQTAFVCMLLLTAGAASAKPDALTDIYRKHHKQLGEAYRRHQVFLMQDGSRALRVARKYGALPPDGTDFTKADAEKENAAGSSATAEPEKPEPDPAASRQIYTAAQELRSVAGALQRPPLSPEGNWNAKAQALKVAATKLFQISTRPGDPRIPMLVARSRDACYGCHRVYGGPLEEKTLLAEGPSDYEEPLKLPQLRRMKTKD